MRSILRMGSMVAIGCTVTVALAYAIMAYAAGNVIISEYLFISFIPGAGELTVVCSALLGASLAFLWYNSHLRKYLWRRWISGSWWTDWMIAFMVVNHLL